MKRYIIALSILAAVTILATLSVHWAAPDHFLRAMPMLAVYFTIVTGLQHLVVVRNLYRSPRRFVSTFLATTVGTLFLHLALLVFYFVSHPHQAKLFAAAFAVLFALFLIFETTALVITVRREKDKRRR